MDGTQLIYNRLFYRLLYISQIIIFLISYIIYVRRGLTIFKYLYSWNKETFLSKCFELINIPELEVLVKQFGNKIPENLEDEKRLRWLVEFSKNWDFRSTQKSAYDLKTEEKARWLIDNSVLDKQQTSAAINAARKLGMIDCTLPAKKEYDTIFVLGGARMSCLFRMKYVKELYEHYGIKAKEIAGLTGMRPIAESERSATDTYAPGANTEFDLMCASAQNIFGVSQPETSTQTINENINSSWAITRYRNIIPITILAAPSSEPEKRRANTADTFVFWEKLKNKQKGKQLLLVTSQIYVPYQQLEAARILGLMYGYNVETVGFPREWSSNMQGLQTAANYLQEIRSTLLSMNKLL